MESVDASAIPHFLWSDVQKSVPGRSAQIASDIKQNIVIQLLNNVMHVP